MSLLVKMIANQVAILRISFLLNSRLYLVVGNEVTEI